MEKLHREFRGRASFLIVYTREPHPGRAYPQPSSYPERVSHAQACRRRHGITMPMVVDDMEGAIQGAYGSLPNMVFVLDKEGKLAYKSAWTMPAEVREALEGLFRRDEAQAQGRRLTSAYTERLTFFGWEDQDRRDTAQVTVFDEVGAPEELDRLYGPDQARALREKTKGGRG